MLGADFDACLEASRIDAVELLDGTFVPQLALIDLGLPPVPHLPTGVQAGWRLARVVERHPLFV